MLSCEHERIVVNSFGTGKCASVIARSCLSIITSLLLLLVLVVLVVVISKTFASFALVR